MQVGFYVNSFNLLKYPLFPKNLILRFDSYHRPKFSFLNYSSIQQKSLDRQQVLNLVMVMADLMYQLVSYDFLLAFTFNLSLFVLNPKPIDY